MRASNGPSNRWIGPLCAVAGVLGFSMKAIFIKLVYAGSSVDPVTRARPPP